MVLVLATRHTSFISLYLLLSPFISLYLLLSSFISLLSPYDFIVITSALRLSSVMRNLLSGRSPTSHTMRPEASVRTS